MKIKKKLKRLLSYILIVCLLFGITVGISSSNPTAEVTAATIDNVTLAATVSVSAGTIEYSVSNNVATITGFTHSNTSVTTVDIPSTLGGYTVTSIGDYAFSGCSSLTSLTIPEGVTSIGVYTFNNCRSLTSITIPSSVKSIGNRAFFYCTSLTSIIIPEGVTSIGKYAFEGCSSLTSVTIPSSVTAMGWNPFRACLKLSSIIVDTNNIKFSSSDGVLFYKNKTTLISYPCAKSGTSYTIPSSVTSIGERAFYYCSSLTSLTIPEGVTSIGSCAFESCSSLTSVTIPSSVIIMGLNPFFHCNSLNSISVAPENTNFSSLDEVLFDKTQTTLISYPCAKSGTSYIIPSTVTKIGNFAFAYCKYLTSVPIPLGVKIIETWAFRTCLLTSVEIPSSVTSMGSNPFYDCRNLSSIRVDSENLNFYSLDGVLFSNNETTLISYPCAKEDTSYTVPLNVTII